MYTIQRRLCTFLLLLALLLSGCTVAPQPAEEHTAPDQPPTYIRVEQLISGAEMNMEPTSPSLDVAVNPEQPYVSTKLFVDGPTLAASDVANIYWVVPQQPLTATYRFDNALTVTRTLTFVCMLDYQQVPCRPDEPTVTAVVPSGQRALVPFAFAGLPDGMHNLLVTAFSYLPVPPNVAMNPPALAELVLRSSEFFWPMAVTIYAGSAKPPAMPQEAIQLVPSSGHITGPLNVRTTARNDPDIAQSAPHPNLTQDENSTGRLLRLKPGERLQLYLVAGFSDSTYSFSAIKELKLDRPTDQLPFVLTALLDTTQISLTGEGPPAPLFSTIPLGQYGIIPLTVVAPNEPGMHSVTVLYQESPYLPGGLFEPQPDGGVVYKYLADPNKMETSNRVTFEVVP